MVASPKMSAVFSAETKPGSKNAGIKRILAPLHNRLHKTTLGGMGASVSQAHETLC